MKSTKQAQELKLRDIAQSPAKVTPDASAAVLQVILKMLKHPTQDAWIIVREILYGFFGHLEA